MSHKKRIALSPPWIQYYRELEALLKQDNDIYITYHSKYPDEGEQYKYNRIEIRCYNYEKTEALKKLIPSEKNFGGEIIKIDIVYDEKSKSAEDIIKQAFKDNPAFKYTYVFDTGTNVITYVVFEKEVVQYWNDDMSDPHGITSTLYADIAKRVLKNENGYVFSTDSDKTNNWIEKYKNSHATREEIEMWERYHGKGSFYIADKETINKAKEKIKKEKKEEKKDRENPPFCKAKDGDEEWPF